MEKKICSKCKCEKNLDEFPRDSSRTDGRFSHCLLCHKARVNEYLAKHPGIRKEYNREKQASDTYRNKRLKLKYGISIDEYNRMLNDQNCCCSICGVHQNKLHRKLAVDHDAKTGQVRGLLCSRCNTAIGLIDHDAAVAQNIITYLRRFI